MKTEFKDWERIKKVIDAYGMRKGFKKGQFLLNFINQIDEYHKDTDFGIVYWNEFYTNLISVVIKTYPDIPLKKLLDEDESYSPIINIEIEHMLNEEIILQDWRNSFNK
ncbi:hypothetical protein ACNQF7_10350 [Flavobacterium sp. RSP29]|uniref:hypothetical protein n=1 Tax=Flavobacterium sp. RSP29 TaxID=3401731 RepID=UPI003AAC1E61